ERGVYLCEAQPVAPSGHVLEPPAYVCQPAYALTVGRQKLVVGIYGHDDFVAAKLALEALLRRQERIGRGEHTFNAAVEADAAGRSVGEPRQQQCCGE